MPPEEDGKGTGGTGGAGGDAGGANDKGTGGAGGAAGAGGEDTTALKAALAKERAARAAAEKERDTLKASVAEGKTGEERTAQMLADLKARADAADLRAMRAEVAAEKGLTSKQASRLQGTTLEELQADADELVAAFKPAEGDGTDASAGAQAGAQRTGGTGRPVEKLRPGASPPADQGAGFDLGKTVSAIPF